MSLVYMLCFDDWYRPYPDAPNYKSAKHYTGTVLGGPKGLAKRLAQHGTDQGAKLMIAVAAAGIGWSVARVWNGYRARERQLKTQGGAARRCPLCGVSPRFKASDLPRTSSGCLARSLLTDDQVHRAGGMTTLQRKEHQRLRQGLVVGRECNLHRIPQVPHDDSWYLPWAVPYVPGRQHRHN